ncbi:MAG: MATE family efflux transporter [Elusimicrobiota bacterium]
MLRGFAFARELRSVFKLAAPIVLLQTGLMLYGTVDTLMVGRLGPHAIACVGLCGSTYFLLFILAMGLLFGIDPLSSKAHGAGRDDLCAEVLVHAVLMALLASLPIFALLSNAGRLFALFRVDPSVAAMASQYMGILRWCLFPGLLFAACRHYLQSQSITRPQLAAVAIGNIFNIVLVRALVFGKMGLPAMGVMGAAWATLSSYTLMFAITAGASALRARGTGFRWRGFQPATARELLRIGLPAGAQMFAEMAAFSIATLLAGRIGATAAAAHQIVMNLSSMTFMIPLGLSHAAAVRVGQGLGRKDPRASAGSGDAALLMGIAFMSIMSLLFFLFPEPILRAYSHDPEVLRIGKSLLAVAAFYQVFDATQIVMTGALRGLGETRRSLLANLIGHWCAGIPVGIFFAFSLGWGALGLWIGLCAGLCLAAVLVLFFWVRLTHPFRRETFPRQESLPAGETKAACGA